jgi:Spy/CpxP family protein refolding chaperone
MKRFAFFLLTFFSLSSIVFSQSTTAVSNEADSYTRTVNQRADKIVNTLGIADSKKATVVRDIIAGQYKNLSNIQADRNKQMQQVKLQNAEDKTATTAAVKKVEDQSALRVDSLHKQYLASLSSHLTDEQVVKVKDGMTYNVLPITYKGYQEMILDLTDEQKKQILAWLTEAREHAMDAESSDKKHAWFGKYKGRINNYLSAQGYDMNKASKDWQARIKAQQATSKN